jgi:hypothetical protein
LRCGSGCATPKFRHCRQCRSAATVRPVAQQTGIRVQLWNPEETIDYPGATGARIGSNGAALVVLRARPRGFDEALDEIPRERWWSWAPYAEPDPTA